MTEHIARPERRSRRWVRAGSEQVGPGEPVDERSMRALEVLVAGLVLAVAGLLSLAQPPEAHSGIVQALVLGSVLFVVALLSLIR